MNSLNNLLVSPPGYQYAVFYINDVSNSSIRHPSVSRRALAGGLSNTPSRWDSFVLEDYAQTEDDGHDVCVFIFT